MFGDTRSDSTVCENVRLSGRLPLAEAHTAMRLGSKQVPATLPKVPASEWHGGQAPTPLKLHFSFSFLLSLCSQMCVHLTCVLGDFTTLPMNKH